jgi:sugar/nucleoside kinase (ribokinase family)
MSLLVTGSIGIDTIQTPRGKADAVLGGSAVYFSFASSLFTPVRLVGVVGDDFPADFRKVFDERRIDIAGLEERQGSKTFRWHGAYKGAMNEAESLRTDLNVLGEKGPTIPDAFRDSQYVFLANTHPALQRDLIGQLAKPKLIVCDTMNLWIETTQDELKKTLSMVNGVVFNDGEARMLTGESNLIDAAHEVLAMGPSFVIIKKGEHGALVVTGDDVFVLPAYPTREVMDPTGAGDSFAGGLLGYLASVDRTDVDALRSAVARGTVTASFTIEGFSLNGLRHADAPAIDKRLSALRNMVRFE